MRTSAAETRGKAPRKPDLPGTLLLRGVGMEKRYGPTVALKDASIEVKAGEVLALVGANGSGKSTLTKIITGVVRPDRASLEVGGKKVEFHKPEDARQVGIAAIYQEQSLFAELPVETNLWLGHELVSQGRLDRREMRKRSVELLDLFQGVVGPKFALQSLVKELGPDESQIVEILKALSVQPRVLIFDESTASLDARQVRRVFELIQKLKEAGAGMVIVTHRMSEIFAVADRITVLRNGSIVGHLGTKETNPEEVVRLMVGDAVEVASALYRQASLAGVSRAPLLEASISCSEKVPSVNFILHHGEILGIGGLQGHGQKDVLMSLFGLTPFDGSLRINGKDAVLRGSSAAVKAGLALVPGDRNREGLLPFRSIFENVLLASWKKYHAGPFLKVGAARRHAETLMAKLRLKAGHLDDPVNSLSGGNAQKVVIGKWLLRAPAILLLDDPTKGIDVGAKREFYGLLTELKAQGLGVIFYSSDDDELSILCDRVLVMYEGAIVEELSHDRLTRESLVRASVRGEV